MRKYPAILHRKIDLSKHLVSEGEIENGLSPDTSDSEKSIKVESE